MWDPAHGKPYASAQLELSFGVWGGEACFRTGAVEMEPGRLELYPYHPFIESSEGSDVAPAPVLPSNKILVYVRSKVIRISSG